VETRGFFVYNNSMSKEILSLENGKVIVVRPKDISTIVPLFCKLCEYPMKTMEDSIAYRKTKVCHHCENAWAKNKNCDISNGIYPNKESEEWLEYIIVRDIASKTIINFK